MNNTGSYNSPKKYDYIIYHIIQFVNRITIYKIWKLHLIKLTKKIKNYKLINGDKNEN